MCYSSGTSGTPIVKNKNKVKQKVRIMGINPNQLKVFIEDVIKFYFGEAQARPNAIKLLMMVAAHESLGGHYLQQVRGPARGIFQMEPATEWDLYQNYARFRTRMRDIYQAVTGESKGAQELHQRGNLIRQIVLARMHFLRFPAPIPPTHDDQALSEYAKKYWNTNAGKATPEQYRVDYYKYVGETP